MKSYVTLLFSILFLIFFLRPTLTYADSLLIPDSTMDFSNYHSHCKKTGYLCTGKYFLEETQKTGTPLFEALINEIDYASESFRAQLISRLYKILKEEGISLEQVEILLGLIEQAKEVSSPNYVKQLIQIEKYLNEVVTLVKENELAEISQEFLVVFKKPLSMDFIKKLKMQNFKIHTTKIAFNKIPKKVTFFSDAKTKDQFLLQGRCENAIVHPSMTIENWQVDSHESCGFAEQFSKVKNASMNFVEENKTSLATTALVMIGVGVLLNNYEVKFTF